jgi:hypothetical protein
MKRYLPLLLFVVLLSSCGVDGKHFKLEGRFLHLNQGEFYVYSEDGSISGIDTIKVDGGRFAYEMPCEDPTTIMLVFPNFSVQPIFAEPGQSVDIKGDASQMKKLTVKGTKDNELMNKFREQIESASPPEAKRYAAQFIADHPESMVAAYLLKTYFVACPEPDYAEALRLATMLRQKQPDNGNVARLLRSVKTYSQCNVGSRLPSFTATDTEGRTVSSAAYMSGLTVVALWSSWSFDSQDMLRMLKAEQRKAGGRLKVIIVSADASRSSCSEPLRRDTIAWPNVCDGKMFEGDLVQRLGLFSMPDNILVENGRVIARSLTIEDLKAKIESRI